MTEFENVLKVLQYNAQCLRADVILGTKGIFGATYRQAMESQLKLDEYEKAIEILENHKA